MNLLGDAAAGFVTSAMDKIAKAMWSAALWVLRGAFELMDSLLAFGDGSGIVDDKGRLAAGTPLFKIWPVLLWISVAVALGLFLWQLTTAVARGGAGFWRAVSGPAAYGIALAMTIGIVAALLGGAEGLTRMLLEEGLDSANFQTMFDTKMAGVFTDNPDLGAAAANTDETVRSLVLFIVALFGVIPAGLGFALQMIFRQGVIWILLATIPITAAGLMTQTTSAMFWRNVRWALAAIIMKPALALILVVGVNLMSAPTGVGGLLVATGVLLIAVFCPMTVYRLLSFVEPGTQAGMALRSLSSQGSASGPGGSGSGGGSSAEEANTARFDAASGGGTGGGAGGSQAGGAAAGGAAGGAALGAAGAVGAVGAAVSGAAHGASNFANSQMDATGIGAGIGGMRNAGSQGGGAPGGDSTSGQGGQGGGEAGGGGPVAPPPAPIDGDADGDSTALGSGGADTAIDQPTLQHEVGSGPGGGALSETSPPEQPAQSNSGSSGTGSGAAGGASEAVIP